MLACLFTYKLIHFKESKALFHAIHHTVDHSRVFSYTNRAIADIKVTPRCLSNLNHGTNIELRLFQMSLLVRAKTPTYPIIIIIQLQINEFCNLKAIKRTWQGYYAKLTANAIHTDHDACTLYKIAGAKQLPLMIIIVLPFPLQHPGTLHSNNMTMDTAATDDDNTIQQQSTGSVTSSTYSVTPVGSLHRKENKEPNSLDEEDTETIRESLSEGIRNPGWLTVLGTFIINFYTWGVLVSWGIFQVL